MTLSGKSQADIDRIIELARNELVDSGASAEELAEFDELMRGNAVGKPMGVIRASAETYTAGAKVTMINEEKS